MIGQYKDKLTSLGLTEKESAVYLALLEEGAATADRTAKLAKLNRSTTYVQINTLTELGLVSTFKKGKKTFFAAESPNNLDRVLDTKSKELEHQKTEALLLVPELMKVYTNTGVRPIIRLFEGKEGLTTMRNEMLESGTKEILVATNYDKFKSLFSMDELKTYSEKRAKKKITSYVMYTKTGDDELLEVAPQYLKRVDAKKYPFGSEVYIYNDTVAITSIDDTVAGVIISSKSVAETVTGIFMMAWNS